jgi:hypothetical protein
VLLTDAGAFSVLDRFFLLFQMHTTPDRAFTDNDMFGPVGCNTFLRTLVRNPSQSFKIYPLPSTHNCTTEENFLPGSAKNFLDLGNLPVR